MNIYVIDTETTGLEPATDRVVEIAAVCVGLDVGRAWSVFEGRESFVNPGRPIPPEASGVHHIIDADVVDAPALFTAIERVLGDMWPATVDVVAAHNARFDRSFLPLLDDKRWIDTYRCAMHVWPDAPNYQNNTLRYWLGIDLPREGAHRALADACVTAHLLCKLLEHKSVDELLSLSTTPVILKKVGFGKHFGSLWSDVPSDYLRWASNQDFDEDVKATISHEIKSRRGGR